nr:RNA-directed DNA polymerase, eukaryota, reverse transcriptase zinc-binding domain protein [Tanacetum cinerariifolium]
MWGELVFTKDSDDNNLWRKRLCVLIKFEDIIMESFKIIIKGRVTVIRAREIIGWIPDFMEEENETSSDSGDEESEKSTTYTDICSGVNGIGSSKSDGKGEMDNNNGDVGEVKSDDPFVEDNIISEKEDDQVNINGSLQETFSKPLQASRQVEKEQYSECNLSSVKDVPLGGFSFTWAIKDDTKMSKLDRFLMSEGLLCNYPAMSGLIPGLILARHLYDHRPIIRRECNVDYSPIPFKMFHSWFDIEGFEQLVKDSWHNDVVVDLNEISYLKKKFQILKKKIKIWVQENKIKANDKRNEIQEKLLNMDKQNDQASGQEDLLNPKRDLWKELRDLDALREKDLVQKATVKWAIEGDENSKYFHGIINKKGIKWLLEVFWLTVSGLWILLRLSSIIGTLVSKEHSAVIRGRQILDGPMILSEVIDWCNQKKRKTMIFKVNFEKAYDSVRWDFLNMILYCFGFGDTWRGWIKGCLVSSSASILVNGSPTREFCFEQGLRQGDPLSPFLFLLVMESLNISFVRAMEGGFFKGIQEGSHESVLTSHLFYADNAVLLGNGKKRIYATYRFFRGMEPGTRKVSWFSWDSVVASKKVGGLVHPEAMWVSIIKAIHGPCGNLNRDIMAGEGSLKENFPRIFALEENKEVWNLDGEGVFLVSSARRFIDEGLCVMDGSPTRWLKLIPIKVNVLAWRLASNKLPTRFNMSLRGLEVPSIDFSVCLKGVETSDHLFFSCLVAFSIVAKVVGWWGLSNIVIYSYQGWLNWFNGLRLKKEVKDYLEGDNRSKIDRLDVRDAHIDARDD